MKLLSAGTESFTHASKVLNSIAIDAETDADCQQRFDVVAQPFQQVRIA